MNHRPRFVVVNTILVIVATSYWWLGVFASFPALPPAELPLLGTIAALFVIGLGAAWFGRWRTVNLIGVVTPIWALCFTTISVVPALSGAADLAAFHALAGALIPNMAGVGVLGWLLTLSWFSAGEGA